jgi:hypothetical protein
MKKIIGILAVLLITVTVSGQGIKSAGNVERQSHWDETKNLPLENNGLPLSNSDRRQQASTYEERIYDYGFYDEKGNIIINDAHFIANGRVFMLSYEPLKDRVAYDIPDNLKNSEVIEAELFLYSKELSKPKSKWEIASVEKIAGKYKPANIIISTYTIHGYSDVDFYMYGERYDTDIGKVVERDNGDVEINIRCFAFEKGKGKVYAETITYVFTPIDNKHYTFRKK